MILVICQKFKNSGLGYSIIIISTENLLLVLLDYNYALSQTATQSTTNGVRFASEAIDGDLSNWSQTRTRTNQWWKVDLGKQIILREIAVYGRIDCPRCGELLPVPLKLT